jgi:pimeloyl-ACP methyl ester carboxylesterase
MRKIDVAGTTIAYRELGSGPAVLLVHGWPTSSYLWRNVMPAIAARNRVIAIDLPGFGESDKPLDVRYSFGFFSRAIDGLLAGLGVERVAVAGHDLGGPVALRWVLDNPARAAGLALLNTLVYPQFSAAVREFVAGLTDPAMRARLTSPDGLAQAMRLGVTDQSAITDDVIAAVVAPFEPEDARRALAAAGIGLEPQGFVDLGRRLPHLRAPLRIVYGEKDRILTDVGETVSRIQCDVPPAVVTALPHCGHFLQEEAPETVGDLLAGFFASL